MAGPPAGFDTCIMPRTHNSGDPGSAITRVLNAEREARKAIDDCAAEAEARLARARSRARAIVRTTQQRIGRMHQACKVDTERRVRDLEAASAREGVSGLRAATARNLLREAAADAARRLTTHAEPEDAN